MFTAQITNEQFIELPFTPRTAAGNVAPIDGTPVATVDAGDASTRIIDNGDGSWKLRVEAGEAGQVNNITVSLDADLGEGVTTISEQVIITVSQAGAESIAFGEAVIGLK